MPTVRYQIRNEYGLADPELYRAADKDDPEAVLEGVAMAGLVGVLRQLGDLAEFAAEIFHDLHEEVTATSARGHGLMLRVQQLEAEFPSIEKAFLVQTSHSHFAYNDGTDWRANLRVDQNLVTQGDMPRFILDSYEECRGPPRLFMLDKFDVAGAGACLKRYSDPSFFKVDYSSSGMMEEEVPWENKARKIRKKASRWRNGETNESFLAPLINSNLQPEISEQVPAKVPTRRVKLKSRNLLDSDITNRKSYMEHLLEVHLPEQQVWSETCIKHSPVIVKSIDSSGSTPEVRETVIDTMADSTIVRETYPTQSPTRKEVAYIPKNELENHKVKSVEMLESVPKKRIMTEPEIKRDSCMSVKAEKRSPPLLGVDQKKLFSDGEVSTEGVFDGDKSDGYRSDEAEKSLTTLAEVDPKKSSVYAELSEFTPEGEYDEYKSDDICSDLDNYMDALNTMESELETDPESRVKSDPGLSSKGAHSIDSGSYEPEQEFPSQPSGPDSVEKSTASRGWNCMLKHPPNSVISDDLADTREPSEHVNGFYVTANQDNFHKESPNKTPDELQGNGEDRDHASSVHLLPNGTCNNEKSDVSGIKSVGETSSGSYVTDLTSSHIHVCPKESAEAQSVTPLPDDTTGYVEDTHVVSQQLDHVEEELSDFTNNPSNFSGEPMPMPMPSSEMGNLSIERKDIPEEIHPAEYFEEHISEIPASTFDMSDHLSETKDETAFEKIPEQHIGESTFTLTANSGEQEEPVKDAEACLDGSVSPNIHELSPEIGPTAVHPKVLASEISSNDVKSSHEVARDLDGIVNIESAVPIVNLRILSDDLLPLSDVPGTINSTEDVEPVFSGDIENIQGKTVSDEVPIGRVEDPPVSTVQLEASQDPMEQDNETCSCENMSPSDPDLSLLNSQSTMQPDADVFPMGVRNIVAGGEDTSAEGMEDRETPLPDIVPVELGHFSDVEPSERETPLPNIVPVELEHFSDAEEPQESRGVSSAELFTSSSEKETFPDDMQLLLNSSAEDSGKNNILMPNKKPFELGHFSDAAEPRESRDADSAEHLPLFSADMQLQNEELGFMAKCDAEEPNESHHAASTEHLPLGSANEIFLDDMQILNEECGLMMTADKEDPKEYPSADTTEHFPLDSANEMFSDDKQLQNKELGGMMIDGAEPVADTLGLPSGSTASILHKESLQLEKLTEFDDSFDEYVIVEADDNNQGSCLVYSEKASGFDVQLQENYLPQDAALDQHDMEVMESSDLKNLTLVAQNESPPIFSAGVSSSELPMLHSSDPSDSKLLDSACGTISSESSIGKETLVYSSENEDAGSNEAITPSSPFLVEPEIPPRDDREPNVVSPHQDGEHLEPLDTQFQRTFTDDKNLTQTKDIADQPSKPEPCVVVSNFERNEVDISLSNIGILEKVEDESSVASRCNSEISVASLVSSATELLPIARSSQAISETSPQEAAIISSSQDISDTNLQETVIACSNQAISETRLQETTETWPGKPTSVASSSQDIAETKLQETTFASSSQAIPDTSLQETSEPWQGKLTSSFQLPDVYEAPPLPPLPPIGWRLGKLRLGSLTSSDIQPQLVTNPFMELIMGDEKYPQGPVTTAVEMVQPGNSFTSLPVMEKEIFQHGSLISEEEIAQPSRLSELPPIADEESKHRSLLLDGEMVNPSNPFLVVSHMEDGKFSSGHGASLPALQDGTTQHPQLLHGQGQHGQQSIPPFGHSLPTLELERSQHEASNIAADPIPPLNTFFVGSSAEEWTQQYGYGVYGGESAQHMNLSAPPVARGPNMPPYGFLYSMGENPSTMYDFMIPTAEAEKPNWRYRSIRDRPRDPLIEAVASHDKSTLRKVSELDRPSVRSKENEDSLLEEIRNKSFNLKPANTMKPNIKGFPPTNLKIAAILEKANSIRQACAGSDEEEDDGDGWSDS